MKIKFSVFVLAVILIFSVNATAVSIPVGCPVAEVLSTDIRAYINGTFIQSYNVNGMTVVVAEDLANYGFDVEWHDGPRSLVINRNSSKQIEQSTPEPTGTAVIGQKIYDCISSDITVFYGTRKIPSYNIDGRTVIYLNDLWLAGSVEWDGDARKLFLVLDDSAYNKELNVILFNKSATNGNNSFISIDAFLYNIKTKKVEKVSSTVSNNQYGYFYDINSEWRERDSIYLGPVLSSVSRPAMINPYYDSEVQNLTSEVAISDVLNRYARAVAEKWKESKSNINGLLGAGDYYGALVARDVFINWSRIDDVPQVREYIGDDINSITAQIGTKWKAAAKGVPISIVNTYFTKNSINIPEANFKFVNISGKTITAFKIQFDCYDAFGNPSRWTSFSSNRYFGYVQQIDFPHLTTDEYYWTLNLHDSTTNVRNVLITEVVFSDGSKWVR